jgi:hypothetical protein
MLYFRTTEGNFVFSWFDIAYIILNISLIFYCFRKYLSSRKKPFKLFGLGFTCLIISDFTWMALITLSELYSITLSELYSILPMYGYIRLALYTIFVLLTINAIQKINSEKP